MKKLKENEAGTEITLKDFKDFYVTRISEVKIYHSKVEAFMVSLTNFIKVKVTGAKIVFMTRSGNTWIDFRKLKPYGIFTDFTSVIFISKDDKITFEFVLSPE